MFGLIPFRREDNHIFGYLDDFEKDLFGDMWQDISQFRTDIVDKGDAFLLQAELPGFDKKDIDIGVEDNFLTIRAQHSEEGDKEENFIRRERRFGSYSRSFDISNINAEEISASYNSGVLELKLPKALPDPKPAGKKIVVQ